MNQTFLARQDFHKCAELHETGNPAQIGLAGLHLMGEAFHHLLGLFCSCFISGRNIHMSVFFHIQLGTGFILDLIDGLAAGTDDITDFSTGMVMAMIFGA